MSRNSKLLTASILGVIVLDQMTKIVASYLGWVSFNEGISFGLFTLLPPRALTGFLLVLLALVWYSYRHAWQRQFLASGLFFGGGISNVIDRMMFGGVRDWVPVPFFNLHNNLADYTIAIGLLWLLFFGLRKNYHQTVAEAELETNQV